MPLESNTAQLLLDHFYLLIALFGIPSSVLGAILFDTQLSRIIYGAANPFLSLFEIGCLFAIPVLILWLRFRLSRPSAPTGFYRHILNFLALQHWHPAVTFSFIGLLILPMVWYGSTNRPLFMTFAILGKRALRMTDVQNSLDGFAVLYQVSLLGGLPLLFLMHLLCRWIRNRYLPWLLIPVLLVGTIIGTILIVTIIHFSQ